MLILLGVRGEVSNIVMVDVFGRISCLGVSLLA